MPVAMLNEYIGKEVTIYVEGELGGFNGTIISVEENWLKVEQKNCTRIVNGDMIYQIMLKKKK